MFSQYSLKSWRFSRAPRPSEILFDNVNVSLFQHILRKFIVRISFIVFIIFFSSPLTLLTTIQEVEYPLVRLSCCPLLSDANRCLLLCSSRDTTFSINPCRHSPVEVVREMLFCLSMEDLAHLSPLSIMLSQIRILDFVCHQHHPNFLSLHDEQHFALSHPVCVPSFIFLIQR